MEEAILIQEHVPAQWKVVQEMRIKVKEKLAGQGPQLTEQVVMAVSELMENAVKYGAKAGASQEVQFQFEMNHGAIKIQVANVVDPDAGGVDDLLKMLRGIQAAEDKEALYVARLVELLERPQKGVSRLGLYRIAYEGGFDLDCKCENALLTMIATRSI